MSGIALVRLGPTEGGKARNSSLISGHVLPVGFASALDAVLDDRGPGPQNGTIGGAGSRQCPFFGTGPALQLEHMDLQRKSDGRFMAAEKEDFGRRGNEIVREDEAT